MSKPESPTDGPYAVGQVVNGHRWTGRAWEPVGAQPQPATAEREPAASAPTPSTSGGHTPPTTDPYGTLNPSPYGSPAPDPYGGPRPAEPMRRRRAWWGYRQAWSAIVLVIALGVGALDTIARPARILTRIAHTPVTATASPVETNAPVRRAPSADVAKDKARSAFAAQFGSFEPITKSGSGSATIALPPYARSGIATIDYRGSSTFVFQGLDAQERGSMDPLLVTTKPWQGSLIYGDDRNIEGPAKIRVVANGPWSVTLKPVHAAPELKLPADSSGSGVYLYRGPAREWTITHAGPRTLAMKARRPNGRWELLANVTGDYRGTVKVPDGPLIITIRALGDWTISAP